jgi:hypothetical protein
MAVRDFGTHLVIRGGGEGFVETCAGTSEVVIVRENLRGEPLQRCVFIRTRGQLGARRHRPVGAYRRRDPRRVSPESSAENVEALLPLAEQGEDVRETGWGADESVNLVVFSRNGECALKERDGGVKIAMEKVNVAEVILGDEQTREMLGWRFSRLKVCLPMRKWRPPSAATRSCRENLVFVHRVLPQTKYCASAA